MKILTINVAFICLTQPELKKKKTFKRQAYGIAVKLLLLCRIRVLASPLLIHFSANESFRNQQMMLK